MKESFAENSEGTSHKQFFMRNSNMPSVSDGSDPTIRIKQTYSTSSRNPYYNNCTCMYIVGKIVLPWCIVQCTEYRIETVTPEPYALEFLHFYIR